jgi:hypothetical protein
VFVLVLKHQANRSLLHLGGKFGLPHGSILSSDGASWKAGAVHCAQPEPWEGAKINLRPKDRDVKLHGQLESQRFRPLSTELFQYGSRIVVGRFKPTLSPRQREEQEFKRYDRASNSCRTWFHVVLV